MTAAALLTDRGLAPPSNGKRSFGSVFVDFQLETELLFKVLPGFGGIARDDDFSGLAGQLPNADIVGPYLECVFVGLLTWRYRKYQKKDFWPFMIAAFGGPLVALGVGRICLWWGI